MVRRRSTIRSINQRRRKNWTGFWILWIMIISTLVVVLMLVLNRPK